MGKKESSEELTRINDGSKIGCPFYGRAIDSSTFFETDNFRCVYNVSPVLVGHSLIIPKKHVRNVLELKREEITEMLELSQKMTTVLLRVFNAEGFDWVLMQNRVAGQTIEHIHLHILPRKENDMASDPRQFFFELLYQEEHGARKKISEEEMNDIVSRIKSVMELI